LYYVVGFIILLGVLIFVHELGHFLIAKLVGVKVLKFSIGFPPALVRRQRGETEYVIGAIPLGGYVKLLGEDPESAEEILPEEAHRTFSAQPLWARTAIVAAGPIFNYVLALVLICAGYLAGAPVLASEVGKILEDKPAMLAGMRQGDLVVGIDGHQVRTWDDMRTLIEKLPGKTVPITVLRDGNEITMQVTPEASKERDPFGNHVGRIGVAPALKELQLGVWDSLREGCKFTFMLTGLVFKTLVKLVKMEMSTDTLGGPIAVLQGSGESLKHGILSFTRFLCYISISLAIINLLPIPVLDGGHLLFFLIEAIIRRPVIGRVRELATQAGFAIILCLMVFVFYNDITRIVSKGWTLQP
jgi:regulator of sigma E protease